MRMFQNYNNKLFQALFTEFQMRQGCFLKVRKTDFSEDLSPDVCRMTKSELDEFHLSGYSARNLNWMLDILRVLAAVLLAGNMEYGWRADHTKWRHYSVLPMTVWWAGCGGEHIMCGALWLPETWTRGSGRWLGGGWLAVFTSGLCTWSSGGHSHIIGS